MIPKFKFLTLNNPSGISCLPTKAEQFATGWDVRANLDKPLTIEAGSYFKIPLGFKAFPEEGWWFQLHPRSSTLAKKNMHCLIGTIDETYADELVLAGQYLPNMRGYSLNVNVPSNSYYESDATSESLNILNFEVPSITIKPGDAIGQIIPIKRQDMIVEEVSKKEFEKLCKARLSFRNGGFGSTDK
jgi:dUTPase